jgi:hypothetical protein
MIAMAIIATAIAEIKLRRVAGIVVLIAKRSLRRSGMPSFIMILFAPASGKPVNVLRVAEERSSTTLDEFAGAKFRARNGALRLHGQPMVNPS